MISHLEYNHRSEYLKVKAIATTSQKCSAVSADQPLIGEAFNQLEPLSTSSKRWKILNQAVSHCIAKDMLPISIVNNVGFRAMLHTFEPRYVVPDRKTFSQNYIPEIYQSEKARIAAAMARGLKNFSLTTDGWTSRANHSYITHTIHYIDELWNLQAHLLDTAEMPSEHTGINLADELRDSLVKWDLKDDDLVSITTDNARNIVCAVEILSWPRFGCLAHTLQIGVKKAMEIPQISTALARARRVVTHFHHSSKSSYILKRKQRDLHVEELSLVQEVTTRWNSSYYMLERLLQQRQPLCATLIEIKKTDLMPSDLEISTMETFLEVLQPIVQITETLGGEKLVTISAVRPLLYKLLSIHLVEKSSDSSLAKTMKNILLGDLKNRYDDVMSLINKACFLDPRFKGLAFMTDSDKSFTIASVEEEAQELSSLESLDTSASTISLTDDDAPPPSKKAKKGLMSLLDDVVNSKSQDEAATLSGSERIKAEVEREMNNYNAIDIDPSKVGNPLVWWRDNQKHYPRLARLARKFLCIPATSVPSERAFSVAGHVVNEKRACLLPENVNMLVFLSANLEVNKKKR